MFLDVDLDRCGNEVTDAAVLFDFLADCRRGDLHDGDIQSEFFDVQQSFWGSQTGKFRPVRFGTPASPCDDQLHGFEKFDWGFPFLEILERVCTDEQIPSRIGFIALQVQYGIDRVANPAALEFDLIDLEFWVSADGEFEHFEAMLICRRGIALFEGRDFCRYELDKVERKFAAKLIGSQEMS